MKLSTAALLLAPAAVVGSTVFDPETHVANPSAGCGNASPYSVGKTTTASVTVAGVKWSYRVKMPSCYDQNTPIPVIFQQPGWGMTASSEASGAGIDLYADSECFVSVTVQGNGDNTNRGGPWYSWNAVGTTLSPGPQGATCTNQASTSSYCYTSCKNCNLKPQCWWTTCTDTGPSATGTGTSVSGFVPSLYDTLESQLCIDTTREYNAGESNGGMMSYQTGVVLADRLAAIAPQFGSFHKGFVMAPSSGLPVIDIHGTNDKTVPANVSLSGDGYYYTTVADIFSGWKKSNGCTGSASHYPTKYDGTKNFYCVSEGDCPGGDVVRCSWSGGHNWLFNDASSNGGMVTSFLLGFTKTSHKGFGGKAAPSLLGEITILTPEEIKMQIALDRNNTLDVDVELEVVEDKKRHAHYGNPKQGCRSDEDKLEAGTGYVCAPKVKNSLTGPNSTLGAGLPVPECEVGHLNSKTSGCPTDARVSRHSKAWPVCLGKGLKAEPYQDGDFHCLLSCPCLSSGNGASCGKESDSHCPGGARCERGELRHMPHGVCTYK